MKLSNRYARPTPAGFRDLNVKFRLDPRAAAGTALGGSLSGDAVAHVCECQVRIAGLDDFAASRDSHRFYEFFRHYFRGDWTQVEQQAATMRGLLEQSSAGGSRDAVRSLLAAADTPPETLDALAGLCGDRLGLMEPAQQLYGRLADLPTLQPLDAICAVGSPVLLDPILADDLWFLIVSENVKGEEGSWGYSGQGDRGNGAVSGFCGASVKNPAPVCP